MPNPWFISPDHNGHYSLEFNGVEIAVGLTSQDLLAMSNEICDALRATALRTFTELNFTDTERTDAE